MDIFKVISVYAPDGFHGLSKAFHPKNLLTFYLPL
jgi:hypothetical protein